MKIIIKIISLIKYNIPNFNKLLIHGSENPLPQGNTFCKIYYPTTGWAVGNVGTILRTTNGGTTGLHKQAEQQTICRVSPLPMQITGRLLVRMAQS